MRFQWIFWVIAIALGAALPWLVHDFVETEKAGIHAPAGESRPLLARAGDFIREKWRSVTSRREAPSAPDGEGSNARAVEVAARIRPALEAELAEKDLEIGAPIFLRLFKEEGLLELWVRSSESDQFEHFKDYKICRWSGDLGPKLKEGDRQAPEGFYFVGAKQMNPQSDFHLSFDLGFPNEYDSHHERTGSYLMVHGDCVSIGCYAMTDEKIEEIYTLADAALANGQKFFRVHALPFRMTDERMDELEEDDEWFDFWSNLKEGYDFFELVRRPPEIRVEEGLYTFHLSDV